MYVTRPLPENDCLSVKGNISGIRVYLTNAINTLMGALGYDTFQLQPHSFTTLPEAKVNTDEAMGYSKAKL